MIQTVAVNIVGKVVIASSVQFDLGTVQILSQLSVCFKQELVLNTCIFILGNL